MDADIVDTPASRHSERLADAGRGARKSSKPGARRAASPVLALLSGAMALREQLPSVVDRGRAGAVLDRRRLRKLVLARRDEIAYSVRARR
jgi:hypothetical protein